MDPIVAPELRQILDKRRRGFGGPDGSHRESCQRRALEKLACLLACIGCLEMAGGTKCDEPLLFAILELDDPASVAAWPYAKAETGKIGIPFD